ncbi:malonyl-ACP O-methyltransferase BioC [Thiobacter aerophilum]|uniref:Malonyl-[acyl-carrier protein] O-methyltransferase n=1 Tax=Thiobacter aerophilum TaxID=3121275 RepID=A0ABV0EEK2_9BURK
MADEALRLDKRLVRLSFERAAQSYDQAAVLQREVAQRMAQRLPYVKLVPRRILDAGAGTGFGTRLLARRYPKAHLIALDLAWAMLKAARAAQPWWQRLAGPARRARYLCGDLERLPLAASSVDLVWSNLTLQWCNAPEQAFRECYRVLVPGGLFMFSTFGPDTLKELRQAFASVDGYTHVNRFVDMHDLGDLLTYAGFAAPVMDMEMITLTYLDLKQLLCELKALGAHNVTFGRNHGLMGKRRWQAMVEAYESLRRDGRLPATFEVVYGHAWVGESKRREDGRQAIALQIARRQAGLR